MTVTSSSYLWLLLFVVSSLFDKSKFGDMFSVRHGPMIDRTFVCILVTLNCFAV